MTTENQRLYLDELSRRWQKSPDEILKMAAKDKLELWFEFRNVIVHIWLVNFKLSVQKIRCIV